MKKPYQMSTLSMRCILKTAVERNFLYMHMNNILPCVNQHNIHWATGECFLVSWLPPLHVHIHAHSNCSSLQYYWYPSNNLCSIVIATVTLVPGKSAHSQKTIIYMGVLPSGLLSCNYSASHGYDELVKITLGLAPSSLHSIMQI